MGRGSIVRSAYEAGGVLVQKEARMSTRSILTVMAGLGLVAMAAVLGVVMGQHTALAQAISIEATPVTDTNPVNTDHTVTATVTDGVVPEPGAQVTFDVTDGPNVGDSGSELTDDNGVATFTYTGDEGAGIDIIQVCVVSIAPRIAGVTALQEPIDCVDVEKIWEEPTPTPSPTPAPTPTPTAAPTPMPTPTPEAAPDILPPSGGEPVGDSGFPWAVVGLMLGGLVLLASGAALLRCAR
jgi:hypothetical protein